MLWEPGEPGTDLQLCPCQPLHLLQGDNIFFSYFSYQAILRFSGGFFSVLEICSFLCLVGPCRHGVAGLWLCLGVTQEPHPPGMLLAMGTA